jgi:hypothetical protein
VLAHDELWFEREPRKWAKQGWIVTAIGRTSKILCPKCGIDYVVYNGNYFCDSWVSRWVHGTNRKRSLAEGECDWALAHPATTVADREICDLIGIDYF